MARKATEYKETNEVVAMPDEALHQAHAITLANEAELHAIKGEYSEERDVINQILGQVQMARSFARFADVVSLTKLKHIKETKMYRALAGKKAFDPEGNEIADIGTFDGFCQALGLSRSKVDEDLTNLAAFGEEALNSLAAIGAGYRELRQFRKLPADQKAALIETAKTGDKDSFLELAEDLIAKHAKEKEALSKQVETLQVESEAKARLLQDKNAKIDELTTLKASVSPWDEKVAQFKLDTVNHFNRLEEGVGQLYLIHGAILQEDTQWGGDEEQERLILRQFATLYGDRLRRLTQQFAELRDHYDATLSGWAAELDTRNLDLFQAGQGDDDVGASDVIGA